MAHESVDDARQPNQREALPSAADLGLLGVETTEPANFFGPNFWKAELVQAKLNGADLLGAAFSDANLTRAKLNGANLRGANFQGADLSGADLRSADLSETNLFQADLEGADLSHAIGVTRQELAVARNVDRALLPDDLPEE